MHPCLLIPELAFHIIQIVADDHHSRYLRNTADVARLARTCKTLAEPALDVLWRTQHSLSPLIMCLSPDVWEFTKRGRISFKRDPIPSDWVAAKKYAHRVWSISQPASLSLPKLDDAALATIFTPSNFGALLPSLRTLDYSVISVAAPMIQLLTDILSTERYLESVTSLTVICPRASQREEVHSLFQAIRTKATRLEALRIESFTSALSNASLAVKLVKGEFQFLRKLDLSWTIHVSTECLACLAEMEYLQEMSLYMRHNISLEFLDNGCSFGVTREHGAVTPHRTFPALRSLKVMAYSLDQCTALMALVSSPFLDNIVFSYDVQAPSALIEAFFSQVQKTLGSMSPMSCAPVTISITLKHNLGPFSSAMEPFLIYPSQALSPLFALPHLRALRLVHLGTIAVDDGFLREAANAWGTHLQEFEERGMGVEESRDLGGFVAATLDGLGAFVRRCPRLERLRVAFDGRRLPDLGAYPDECRSEVGSDSDKDEEGKGKRDGARVSPSVLQVLNVRDSPIDDPACVAKFLKQVAPALRVITVEGSLDMWRLWREVEDRMRLAGGCDSVGDKVCIRG